MIQAAMALFLTLGNMKDKSRMMDREKVNNRVVGNWVKFHILIYLGPLHKYPIKEDFFTSWGVKSIVKPCRQNHRLTMGTFFLP